MVCWPPTSHTFSLNERYSSVLMLKPRVGATASIASPLNLLRIVDLPALSRPLNGRRRNREATGAAEGQWQRRQRHDGLLSRHCNPAPLSHPLLPATPLRSSGFVQHEQPHLLLFPFDLPQNLQQTHGGDGGSAGGGCDGTALHWVVGVRWWCACVCSCWVSGGLCCFFLFFGVSCFSLPPLWPTGPLFLFRPLPHRLTA